MANNENLNDNANKYTMQLDFFYLNYEPNVNQRKAYIKMSDSGNSNFSFDPILYWVNDGSVTFSIFFDFVKNNLDNNYYRLSIENNSYKLNDNSTYDISPLNYFETQNSEGVNYCGFVTFSRPDIVPGDLVYCRFSLDYSLINL